MERWRTWWFHPDMRAVELDGFENGHWRHVAAAPSTMVDDPEFPRFIASSDVEEDYDARLRMKHAVFLAGWVRVGLVSDREGYADGIRSASVAKAGRFLMGKSAELARLDVTLIPRNFAAYGESAGEETWVRLEGETLAKALRSGAIPRRRAPPGLCP